MSFFFTEVFIGINNAFQIINVINSYAGNIGQSGVDVTRNGNINQNQRSAVALGQQRSQIFYGKHVMRRTGRGDNDIGISGMLEHGTVGNSRTVELACQVLCSFVVAIADANSLRTLVQQMLCSKLTHMTGTYHQNLGLAQVA